MRIIELCGKPGVGKSTLVDEIKKREVNSEDLIYREDVLKSNLVLDKIYKTLFYCIYFLFPFGNIKKIKDVVNKIQDIELKYIYRFYVLYVRLKRYLKKDVTILLEEGPLQYISSLAHLNDIERETMLFELIPLFDEFEMLFVVCECSSEQCIERIYNRRKKGDRFWNEDKNIINARISMKEHNIEVLLEHFNRKKCFLNMELSINENVKILEGYI